MTFAEASQELKRCPTDEDLALQAGVSVQAIRQARLDESSPSYRTPPAGWSAAIAALARARAEKLVDLARYLEDS